MQVGLSREEAQRRLARSGRNELRAKKKKGFFLRFLDQFKDVMILILIGAALISFAIAPVSYTHLDVYKRQLHADEAQIPPVALQLFPGPRAEGTPDHV